MKKIFFVFFLVLLYMTNNILGEQKNLTKLLGGSALLGIGGILMISGFTMKSVSIPEIKMQFFTWSKSNPSNWQADYNGTIKNTGTVEMKNIKLIITYKDIYGVKIGSQTINGPSLLTPEAAYNFNGSYDCGSTEPGFSSVEYRADFTEQLENNNLILGFSGVAVAATGLFFIADYLFDFTSPLQNNNITIELLPFYAGIKFKTIKYF